jgi:hypothetical protein
MMMIYLTSPSFVLDLKPLEVGLRLVGLHKSLRQNTYSKYFLAMSYDDWRDVYEANAKETYMQK